MDKVLIMGLKQALRGKNTNAMIDSYFAELNSGNPERIEMTPKMNDAIELVMTIRPNLIITTPCFFD